MLTDLLNGNPAAVFYVFPAVLILRALLVARRALR